MFRSLTLSALSLSLSLLAGAWPGTASAGVLVITEIQYNPLEGGRDGEFIELHNASPDPLDLTGYSFQRGIAFTFTERTFLDPGAYLVVCANGEFIRSLHGISNVTGDWDPSASLDNGGETIEIANPAGVSEAMVKYNDRGKWPSGADGTGHSLELADPYSELDDPDHWRLSRDLGGSPGKANPAPATTVAVVVNEAQCLGAAGTRWVEFYNRGDEDADLSGFRVTTNPANLAGPALPEGSVVPARGWIAVTDEALGLDFLPGAGGRTFLALADPAATRVVDAHIFEPARAEFIEARLPDGGSTFSSVALPTRGAANRDEAETDVVLNEIHYHPRGDDLRAEFVELFNRGERTVDLSGWRFADGIRFDFPPGTSLEADAYLVVARDPEWIRETYALDGSRVLGPLSEEATAAFGVLADGGERITLEDSLGRVADTVRYHDGGEWPEWADGGGSSLELIDPFQSNDVGQAWDASDDSAAAIAKEYAYTATYTAGEPEFHIVLPEAGIVDLDDIEVVTQTVEVEVIDTLVDWEDEVRYWKGSVEPSEPMELWRGRDFDDSAWAAGRPIIGFGDGDETTLLEDMKSAYLSFYVRRAFDVADPAAFESLILDIEYDDGFVAYLNGVEVASGNMRPERRAHDSAATLAREKFKETLDLSAQRAILVPGRNVLAVQVHNSSLTSNDARYRARLANGRFVTAEGPNLVKDGSFESDTYKSSWVIQGTHYRSGRTSEAPLSGAGTLRVISTGGGDNKVNRIETSNTGFATPTARVPYRVSFTARWIVGCPTILTHGAYQRSTPAAFASSTRLELPERLGTPGAPNSVSLRQAAREGTANLGPVIWDVEQDPVVPAAGRAVTVRARAWDPDGVAEASLLWSLETPRADGDPQLFKLPMAGPDADGYYAAEIPGQTIRKRVVFHLVALDSGGRRGRFPLGRLQRTHPLVLDPTQAGPNDSRWCVYRHDNAAAVKPQSYRFWLHQANEQYLATRPLHSNDLVDGSFIFQNKAMYYNSWVRFSGSPFARQAWSESYRIRMPDDRPLHGSIESFNLEDHQGVGGRDGHERISHYLIRNHQGRTRVPYSLQWIVQLQVLDRVNEAREHVQTPNREFLERWWPGDDEGDFFEMDDRHFFNDAGTRQDSEDGRLLYPPYGAAALGEDKEGYRYYFNLRTREEEDDYVRFIALAKLMSPTATPNAEFDERISSEVDVEQFLRMWSIRLNTDDWDTWGASRGKNCYFYRPRLAGRWVNIPWDMELTYGSVTSFLPPTLTATSNPSYTSAFAEVTRFLNRPRIKRMYYGILQELVDGPFQSAFLSPYMTKLDQVQIQSTAVGKAGGFIDQRRTRILAAVRGVTSPQIAMAVTTNGGAPWSVEGSEVTIEGRAPVEVATIALRVNGADSDALGFEFSDTNVLGWTAHGTLPEGANALEFFGFDFLGELVGSTAFALTVTIPEEPSIESITPSRLAPGESALILGRNFRNGARVLFGDVESAEVTYDPALDPTRIRAIVPAGLPPGTLGVKVVLEGGSASPAFPVEIVEAKRRFVRGDADRSGTLDLTDALATLRFLFQGGATPLCLDAADTDDDGSLGLTDAVVTLRFLFQGGPAPAAPWPLVGEDASADLLDCALGLE